MNYQELLKKAREKAPQKKVEKERFEIPTVKSHIQGSTTILSNFIQIADYLNRKPEHLLKYILKELATPGELKKTGSVIIRSKVPSSRINEKIQAYTKEFVLCKECGKPDTELIKEDRITFLRCLACGARRPVKELIK